MARKNLIFLAILVFGLTFLGSTQAKAEVKLVAKIDKEKAAVGEKILLTADLEWEQVENEEIKITKISSPECPLLELVDSSQVSNSELRSGRVISNQTLRYIFRAKEEGIGKISALRAEYIVEGDEQKFVVSSEPIEVKVISLKEKFISGLGFMASILAGIFVTILSVCLFLRKRRRKQNSALSVELTDTRYELEAIDRLRGITKYCLDGDFKKYYTQLHYILTDYVRAKYHIQIRNKSEEEIRQLSSKVNIPGEALRLLIETVRFSEKVRFAGYEVSPNEEKRIFDDIQRYLRSLIPKEKEERIELVEENKNEEV